MGRRRGWSGARGRHGRCRAKLCRYPIVTPPARRPDPFGLSAHSSRNLSAGWIVENDQQTATAYKGSDLQLGMISAGATPTVAMTHKMGLVRLNPTTKSVANKLTYT